MGKEDLSHLHKTVTQEIAAATGQALRDVYNRTAEQALPFRQSPGCSFCSNDRPQGIWHLSLEMSVIVVQPSSCFATVAKEDRSALHRVFEVQVALSQALSRTSLRNDG
jgi:hypothetical protein